MKYLKNTKKFGESTIRKIVSDDKTAVYGVVGTVGDLLDKGVLTYCDFERHVWCAIGRNGLAAFGHSRAEAVEDMGIEEVDA